ncbi:hypothetical protein EYF80_066489 [Liparis tanakae]|uniref:Secreted protein n=1 Tax=Liparis tanakae TaxID=230148 RepID=A0A4Z2E3T9_9TELE|nr:hypothetical protein EYF80_066489 [Liparis tanakae]
MASCCLSVVLLVPTCPVPISYPTTRLEAVAPAVSASCMLRPPALLARRLPILQRLGPSHHAQCPSRCVSLCLSRC